MVGFEMAGTRITLDDETLRETVEDPANLAQWCREHPDDPRTVAALRILGRLDEAAAAGRAALAPPDLPPLVRAARRARYAHVLQWQGAYRAAEELLDLAAEETGLEDPTSASSLALLATVFQHRAKCRFEHSRAARAQGRTETAHMLWEAARDDARRALHLRENLEITDHGAIASSRQTLERLTREESA